MRLCTAVIDEPVDDSFLSRRAPGGAMAEAGTACEVGGGCPHKNKRSAVSRAAGPRRGSWHTVTPDEFLPRCGFLQSKPGNCSLAWRSSTPSSRTGGKSSRCRVPSSSRRTCPRPPLPRSPSRRCASASHPRRGNDVMLRRRALAGSRAVLAGLCGPRAGARPNRRIPGSELQLIAGRGTRSRSRSGSVVRRRAGVAGAAAGHGCRAADGGRCRCKALRPAGRDVQSRIQRRRGHT